MSNVGRFRDTAPGIKPAGKSMPVDNDGVKSSLAFPDDGRDDHVGRRVAQRNDPSINPNQAFGKGSGLGKGPSAKDALRPKDRTSFQDVVESRAPPKRPQGTKVDDSNVFGTVQKKESSVRDCMQAPDEPEQQNPLSSSLRIPRNYGPGQQTKRDYGSGYSDDKQFGKPTPNDPSGSLVRNTLHWQGAEPGKTTIVPAQSEKHRRGPDRVDPTTTPALGHPPLSDRSNASTLLNYDRDRQQRVVYLTDLARKIRPEALKLGADRMQELRQSFSTADKDGSGKLNKQELQSVLLDLGFNLPAAETQQLLHTCDANNDGEIDYEEFLSVVDFARPLPNEQDFEKKPLHLDSDKPLGMGTIRTDRPPPRNKSVADTTNYGDPTTAGSLITPSAATRAGLDAHALEEKRDMDEIRRLFRAMGVSMSDGQFEETFEVASGESADGKASILDFQRAMKDLSS